MFRKTFLAKALSLIIITMVLILPLNTLFAQAMADRPVTQGEFAVYLVRALGLEAQLQLGAHTRDYVQLLEEQGINPPGGFEMNKPLNKKDMAFIMVKATGIENRVINKMSEKSLVKKGKAVIKTIEGDVQFQRGRGTEFAKAQINDELFAEDSLRTGKTSSVELQIGRFGAVFIGENTEITIEQLAQVGQNKKDKVRIFLKQGQLVANVKSETKLVDFETRTKTTVAGVMGTIYLHSSTPAKEIIITGEGTVRTFTTNNAGKPTSEIKPLEAKGMMTADPTGKEKPNYSQATEVQLKNLLETGKKLARLLTKLPPGLGAGKLDNTAGEGNEPVTPADLGIKNKSTEGLSDRAANTSGTYDERQKLARGDDEAYKAAIQALNEAGIPVDDSTGAATAANTLITLTQITQFLEDLLVEPLYFRFNNDVTPIGQ
ncbi:FecR domain-containing protein [bacterium]|nr:FecR domain-containing protein [bacterium]